MSVPAKKAAEAVAKKVIPAASRAVSAAEAPSIVPASRSSENPADTSMPWDGWVSSFITSKLGQEKFDTLKSYIVWKPEDRHNLEQIPKPSSAYAVPLTDKEDGPKVNFRTPSPGSMVREDGSYKTNIQPSEDEGTLYDDPYFNAYYPRDTARRHADPAFPNPELEEMKLALLPDDDVNVQAARAEFEEGPRSSPGNKGMFATGKSTFDTTGGLRAAMSTNHETVQASLDSFMPNHLPKETWWDNQNEIAEWCEEQDLPAPIGATGFGTVPREGRIARW